MDVIVPAKVDMIAALLVDENGNPTGGGGGDGASAANQAIQITAEQAILTSFGLPADTEATNDTGSFSFLSFVKRLLNTKLKIGQQTKAASLAVVPASDWGAFDLTDKFKVSLYGNSSTVIGSNTITDNSNIGNALSAYAMTGLLSPPAGANAVKLARNVEKFFTATATASGDTALWTPTSAKKFRLMRFRIEVTADVATSGGAVIDVVLRDSTTGLAAAYSFYAPATSVVTNPGAQGTGWTDLGNGILSAVANNVLNINLSAALTSGKVRVAAAGTEE